MPAGSVARLLHFEPGGVRTALDITTPDGSKSFGVFVRTPGGWVPVQAGMTSQVTVSTRFGACVPQFKPGSTTVAGSEADIVAKFGPKSMVRKFNGTPTSTPPPKTTGASGNHVSWSFGIKVPPTFSQAQRDANDAMAQRIINGEFDTQISNSAFGLDPAYFYAEVLHELDTKANGNHLSLTLGQQLKEHTYNVIKNANSALLVPMTMQAYGFSTTNPLWTNGTFVSRYGSLPHDVIGLDFDGIAPGKDANGNYVLPYPTLQSNRMQNAQQWVRDRGLAGWAVPEWGTLANAVAADADNQVLADTFITYLGQQWVSSSMPPLFACWYDYGPNPEAEASVYSDLLSQPASIGALQQLVASSVALAA